MNFTTVLKYIGAFAAGFVGFLVPTLASGHWPASDQIPTAIAFGLGATGLFHIVPPRAQ